MESNGSNKESDAEDQKLATVAALIPELPNLRAAPPDRFAQAVRTLVEKRALLDWPNESKANVSVFVMVDYPRQFGEQYGGIPFADPVAQGTPVLGKLLFSNADASHGQLMDMPTEAHAILDWLADAGLDDRPIVTVYRNANEMVTRRAGIHNSAQRDAIRDEEPLATLPELMAALNHFHKTRALTPSTCPTGTWESKIAHRYIPGPQPETSIQSDLELALNFWFRGAVKAESEDSTNIGRIDVRLLKRAAQGGLTYWAILELKVIKSFTNAPSASNSSEVPETTNVQSIVDGIVQAAAYQVNRDAEIGMLEVYDLRKDKTEDLMNRPRVFNTLQQYTPPPDVHVWPLFGSSQDARKAGFTGI